MISFAPVSNRLSRSRRHGCGSWRTARLRRRFLCCLDTCGARRCAKFGSLRCRASGEAMRFAQSRRSLPARSRIFLHWRFLATSLSKRASCTPALSAMAERIGVCTNSMLRDTRRAGLHPRCIPATPFWDGLGNGISLNRYVCLLIRRNASRYVSF
jgi:hypothetical protein